MARRKSGDEGASGDSWLNTYADMVTLLLTFFVLLFSMSSMEETKWQELVQSFKKTGDESNQIIITPEGDGTQIGANHGIPAGNNSTASGQASTVNDLPVDFNELYQYLLNYVQMENLTSSVTVEKSGESSVLIRFANSIFFNPDSAKIKPEGQKVLETMGKAIESVQDQILAVNVGGHTANIPNYAVSDRLLSSERANSVAMYFDDHTKMDGAKVLGLGYGNKHPIADNDTEAGRATNRRVEIAIISTAADVAKNDMFNQMLSGTYDKDKYPQDVNGIDLLIPDANKDAATTEPAPAEPAATPAAPPPAETPPAAVPAPPTGTPGTGTPELGKK